MDTILDKLPPSLQGWAALGALIFGAIAWMLGARTQKQPPESSDLEELHRLRAELGQAELRRDLEAVLAANRKAYFGELGRLETRVRELEQSVAVLEAGPRRRLFKKNAGGSMRWWRIAAAVLALAMIAAPAAQCRELVTVSTAAGVDITVAPAAAAKFQGFIRDLVQLRGYKPKHIGCFARGGHVKRSRHYSGHACDFDQTGWNRTARAMYRIGDLAAKWGLRNGCSFGDCGHVDVPPDRADRPPENIYTATARWRAAQAL